jgi:hypothetical protein
MFAGMRRDQENIAPLNISGGRLTLWAIGWAAILVIIAYLLS